MKYRIITIISFIGSTVISLLGGWDKSLQTLMFWTTGAQLEKSQMMGTEYVRDAVCMDLFAMRHFPS